MQANQANVTFNTHEAVKALKSSGFDEKQAESVVETIDKAVNETVATKADLKAEISKLETRMMRMMLLQSAVLVGLLIPVFGMLITLVVKLL